MRRRALGHKPGLDGVRAAAVLGVMAVHTDLPYLWGGGRGVDVFFVLSGFLITTLMLEEQQKTARVSLPDFYARRALRLFPALWVLLIVVSASVAFVETGETVKRMLSQALWAFTYTTNIFAVGDSVGPPLGHTWSLALEEQFYLVWPVVFVLGCRFVGKRVLAFCLAAAVVSIMGIRLFGRSFSIGGLVGQRPDALLIGCLGSFAWWRIGESESWRLRSARVAPAAGAVGCVVLAWLMTIGHRVVGPSIRATGSAVAALAVIWMMVEAPRCLLARAGAVPVAVWIGRRSYGIYLWHVPVFWAITSLGLSGPDELRVLLKFALTFAIAAISFTLIEAPALRLKQRFRSEPSPQTLDLH